MSTFAANTGELADAIRYELDTLEYLRFTLHNQVETAGDGMSLVVGDLTPDGEQRRQLYMRCTMSSSEDAVRAALNRFRPLAFSAAFKLQDMVAEWILRANGLTDWPFSKKIAGYDRLRSAGALAEPTLFVGNSLLGCAFWELYRFLIPYRSSVVHSGGVALERDGTIAITRNAQTLRFTSPDQASYMRVMCLIGKMLTGQVPRNEFIDSLVQADMHALSRHHGQTGFSVQGARLETLIVHVEAPQIQLQSPLTIVLDFQHFRRTMERTFPVGVDGKLYYSVEVVVHTGQGRDFTWLLPVEAVPAGLVTLREGDPQFDCFLRISATA